MLASLASLLFDGEKFCDIIGVKFHTSIFRKNIYPCSSWMSNWVTTRGTFVVHEYPKTWYGNASMPTSYSWQMAP